MLERANKRRKYVSRVLAGMLILCAVLLAGNVVRQPCTYGAAECPVGSTTVFDQDLGIQGGTAFTATLTAAPTVARTLTLPDATDTLVGRATTDTLTNKTLTSPVLTTPQINDTSADDQYIFVVSELAADRTVTMPLLTGPATFAFTNFAQTWGAAQDFNNENLTNLDIDSGTMSGVTLDGTLDAGNQTISNIGNAGNDFAAAQLDLAAGYTVLGANVLNINTTVGDINLGPAGDVSVGANTVVLGDTSADPNAAGEIQRNAADVKVYTGGAVHNLSYVFPGMKLECLYTAEGSTTAIVSADIITTSACDIPAEHPLLVVFQARKSTGHASASQCGLKLNVTQLIPNAVFTSALDTLEAATFFIYVPPRDKSDYFRESGRYGTVAVLVGPTETGGGTWGTAGVLGLVGDDATSFTVTGFSGNGANTTAAANLYVYSLPISQS